MKKDLKSCDKLLLILMIIFSLFGLLMVFSASSVFSVIANHNSPYYYFFKQAIFICAGYFVGFFFLIRIPIKKYQKLIILGIGTMFFLLVGLIIKGELINGSKSWYDLGFFNLQPSEFVKTIYIFYVANFYYLYQRSNKEHGEYYFIRPLLVCIALTIPILLQPDLGTAVILCGIAFGTVLFVPLEKEKKNKLIIGYLAIIIIVFSAFFLAKDSLLTETQIARLTYKEPCKRYTQKTGYQVCNSLIAISNGGLFGAGFGNSTQKYMYLPAAHTDFIFAIVVEECGVIISSFVIILYLFLLYRIFKIAKTASNLRNSIIAFGTFIYVLLHLVINLFGITGLIPLTGVPLPFLSYGGSYNINLLILLFIVLRCSVETNQDIIKEKLRKI